MSTQPSIQEGTGTTFHATVLSNLARGYDRYRRVYSKRAVPESTYPEEFYVLPRAGLPVGIAKASRLKAKLGIERGDLVVLEAPLSSASLGPHPRGGPGSSGPRPTCP